MKDQRPCYFLKLQEYIKRYGIAELVSYTCAIIGGSMVYYATESHAIAAFVVIVGDNLWYYGTIAIQEFMRYYQKNWFSYLLFPKVWASLGFEFWLPQIIETLVVYPALLYYIPQLFTSYPVWIFVAMTLAILIFYLQAIILYEIKKKYFNI